MVMKLWYDDCNSYRIYYILYIVPNWHATLVMKPTRRITLVCMGLIGGTVTGFIYSIIRDSQVQSLTGKPHLLKTQFPNVEVNNFQMKSTETELDLHRLRSTRSYYK